MRLVAVDESKHRQRRQKSSVHRSMVFFFFPLSERPERSGAQEESNPEKRETLKGPPGHKSPARSADREFVRQKEEQKEEEGKKKRGCVFERGL